MRACLPKRHEEKRDTPGPSAPLFMYFRHPPPTSLGLPYVNWASQECCLFYLRPSLRSSDLPLLYFHGLFPSLSFSHHHSGLLFPILTTEHVDENICPLKEEELLLSTDPIISECTQLAFSYNSYKSQHFQTTLGHPLPLNLGWLRRLA